MTDLLFRIARKFHPSLESLSGQRRIAGVADVLTLLYSLPLAGLGLVWLVRLTDLELVRREWAFFFLLAGLMYLFNRLSFFVITEIRSGGYANTDGAMDGIVLWTALLLYGPTALWLDFLWNTVYFIGNWRRSFTTSARWNRTRVFVTGEAAMLLGTLVALTFYQSQGGTFPLTGLTPGVIATTMAAMVLQFLTITILLSGYILYVIWSIIALPDTSSVLPIVRFFVLAVGLPFMANPFAILTTGLYIEHGLLVFLFFIVGLLLVALLARRLSWAAENSRQQSRQLEELEKLGRALLNAPPDASSLPEILQEHVPSMFAAGRVFIWISPDQLLLVRPEDWQFDVQPFWKWLNRQEAAQVILTNEVLPWREQATSHGPLVVAPIFDAESEQPLGGIYLELQSLALPWDSHALVGLLPAVQSLSAQVASALHQARVYARTLTQQRTIQQLSLARGIQASFLPERVPDIPGWQLAAVLEPAREISGDFYDFFLLSDGKWGILIADVADKGLGSALYMALSRTLIRTFATQFESQPELVMSASNERILKDARANLFVTVFYGVLDPATGTFTYCNAGHNPPLLYNFNNGDQIKLLGNTGMPLGIEDVAKWEKVTISLNEGDVLLLYTDGLTDAQNTSEEFIERGWLVESVKKKNGFSAHEMQQAIMEEVHRFTGEAPQFDDMTMVILIREYHQRE